jgi:Domain of unknown function DUF29
MADVSIKGNPGKTGDKFLFPQNPGSSSTEFSTKKSKDENKKFRSSSVSNYDTDFIAWIEATTQLLKQGKFKELDIENLIEEVEDLGKNQRRELKSRLRVLLMHLLKWQYQPNFRSYPDTKNDWNENSWARTITTQRNDIQDLLADSPSLYNYFSQELENSYQKVRFNASKETHLEVSRFPESIPYTAFQVLSDEFWPD